MVTEEERDLHLSYSLGYPEPNVVIALCRGSRSSPPVREILFTLISVIRHSQKKKKIYPSHPPLLTVLELYLTENEVQVRVYTAEEVSSELEAAKVEYLERCVRVVPVVGARRKKMKASATIVLPKLLHWHMRCFADDVESLLEWVHSQLPRSTSAVELKRAIRDLLLHRDTTPVPEKMVEIEPYDAEFCYLLPLIL
jgi:hypothetical protein